MKILLQSVLIFMLVIGINSTNLIIAQESNSLVLNEVFEMSFDEEVEDVVFDEIRVPVKKAMALGTKGLSKENLDKEVEIDYPKVVKTTNRVIWFNKDGKVINELSLDQFGKPYEMEGERLNYYNKVHLLRDGKVLIGNRVHELIFNLFVYDDKGNLIWSKENLRDTFLISGNGKYIVTSRWPGLGEGTSQCILYDIEGNELWRKKLSISFMGDWIVHILYDGKAIIVELKTIPLTEQGFRGSVRRESKIYLVNTDGAKLWEYSDLQPGDYDILSTIDKKIIIYTSGSSEKLEDCPYALYGFDENGKLLWEPKKTKGFKNKFHKLILSKEGNYLGGFTSWENVWIMDINSGKFIWKRSLNELNISKEDRHFAFNISDDGKFVTIMSYLRAMQTLKGIKGDFEEFILFETKNGAILKRDNIDIGNFGNSNNLIRLKDNKLEIRRIELKK